MLPVMTHTLADIVKRVASAPVLLVATDFDGTLAPLVEHHALAAPNADLPPVSVPGAMRVWG